jgi:hypothetical protein
MVLAEARFRFTKEQARAFIERMCNWLNECEEEPESEAGEDYVLSAALFPIREQGPAEGS